MKTTHPLTDAGQQATRAAAALTKATRPRAAAARLTLAEHAAVVASLSITIDYLCGDGQLIPVIVNLIDDTRDRYAQLDNRLGRYFKRELSTVYDNAQHAQDLLCEIDLADACALVERDGGRLAGSQPGDPQPTSIPPNPIGARVTAAIGTIRELTAAIETERRPIADILAALTPAAALLRALSTAYRQEAHLVTYHSAPFIYNAPTGQLAQYLVEFRAGSTAVTGALTGTADTLGAASQALAAGARTTDRPARAEASVLADAWTPRRLWHTARAGRPSRIG